MSPGQPDWLADALADIPLLRAVQMEVVRADPALVELRAPFSPNRNDKGTAFAGSQATLATLSGWIMTSLLAAETGQRYAAAVAHSELDYLRPGLADLRIICPAPDTAALAAFQDALKRKGRGRLSLQAEVWSGDTQVLRYRGDYAAFPYPADAAEPSR